MRTSIGKRLAIGTAITVIGLIAALIFRNFTIFTNWVSGLGFVLLIVGCLPFLGQNRRMFINRVAKKEEDKDINARNESGMRWGVSVMLIALPMTILPTVFYVLWK